MMCTIMGYLLYERIAEMHLSCSMWTLLSTDTITTLIDVHHNPSSSWLDCVFANVAPPPP